MYYGLHKQNQNVRKHQIKPFYLNVDRAIFLQMTFPFCSASTIFISHSQKSRAKNSQDNIKIP